MKIDLVYHNDLLKICHDACKLCYESSPEKDINKMAKYIGKKVEVGHESVIEHSNVVYYIECENNSTNNLDLLTIASKSKYINISIKYTDTKIYAIIGGSIRGIKEMIKEFNRTDMFNNKILVGFIKKLYLLPEAFFKDLIDIGIMNNGGFKDPLVVQNRYKEHEIHVKNEINLNFEITSFSNIGYLKNRIDLHTKKDLFSYKDLLDFCTITVFVKNMSRCASMQMIRHRNAISQQSQRYVKITEDEFVTPDEFDTTKGVDYKEISKTMKAVYNDLVSDGELKQKNEDARYILPQSVSTKLYMTFTFRKLLHFFNVRTGKSAQAEIRNIALSLQELFIEGNNFVFDHKEDKIFTHDNLFDYILPNNMNEVGSDLSEDDENKDKSVMDVIGGEV